MGEEGRPVPRRIYPLDPRHLTQEEVAVVLAMTSRRPEPFDEIAQQVTAQKAAEFHEKWVVGYGHASEAEHAILHFAVENISRLACDALEDARLASYTEKSSRFQVLPEGYFFVPSELEGQPALKEAFTEACASLFQAYHHCLKGLPAFLATVRARKEGEKEGAYNLRLRREALDACRFLLPAATLTSVGLTINARALEHTLTKLLTWDLQEVREIGAALKEQGRRVTPTLIKYAEESPYLKARQGAGRTLAAEWQTPLANGRPQVRLLHYDPQGEEKVVASFLYFFAHRPYEEVWEQACSMRQEERARVLQEAWGRMGAFDAPGREAEAVSYTLEVALDYGAYRELKRHRMMTLLPQPLTPAHGYVVPSLVTQGGLEGPYREALAGAEKAYGRVASSSPVVAEYLVAHAHLRRALVHLNLRQCYNVFKLRTGPQAHPTIRQMAEEALRLCQEVHPSLFAAFQRRTA